MDYFTWLCDQIDPEYQKRGKYHSLLERLYLRPFEWSVKGNLSRDENRAIDGKQLRKEYARFSGMNMDMFVPASVLEVLVALAINIDNGLVAGDGRQADWFWLMLTNLGLLEEGCEADYILNRWLHRQFRWDGSGSPFPLTKCKFDQRRVELWLQACGYFSEEIEVDW